MNIVILSRGAANYTTRRLKEEAEKRGHNVRVVNYSKCYMTIEKGNPVVYYRGEALDNIDAIIPRIAQSYTKYGCAVVRQFEMRDVYTTAKSIAIDRSRNKLRSYQLLAKAKVGIPKTVFAHETASCRSANSCLISAVESSVSHASPAPMTWSAMAFLRSIISSILSSSVPTQMNL